MVRLSNTKEDLCHDMDLIRYHRESKYDNIILQCGASFWLFLVTLEYEKPVWGNKSISDFDLDLLVTWKDYTKPNALLKLDMSYYNVGYCRNWKAKNDERVDIDPDRVISSFKSRSKIVLDGGSLSTRTVRNSGGNRSVSNIPILKNSGIASVVNPLDLFCAIEEYFSIEKTSLERTEAIGATNNDKIIMHGFDTKTSFRGKV